jgi:hypothetical protein
MSEYNPLYVEYTQWFLTEVLLDHLITSTLIDVYEARNILERWLQSMCNIEDENVEDKSNNVTKTWSTVYRILPPNHPINQKLVSEIEARNQTVPLTSFTTTLPPLIVGAAPQITFSASAAGRLKHTKLPQVLSSDVTEKILSLVKETLEKPPSSPTALHLSTDIADKKIPKFTYENTKRIQHLLSVSSAQGKEGKGREEDILRMIMRYTTLFGQSGGQQWGFTQKHFDQLYKCANVRLECFASPLNSRLLSYISSTDKVSFCSLFPDTDKKFGSLGNFFSLSLNELLTSSSSSSPSTSSSAGASQGNLQVNPPFVETILEQASIKCLQLIKRAQELKINLKIFFHGPDWQDSAYFRNFNFSQELEKFAKDDEKKEKDYEKCEEEKKDDKEEKKENLSSVTEVVIVKNKLLKGKFYLEKPNGEVFLSSVNNWYFCLSSTPFSLQELLSVKKLLQSPTTF